MDEEQKASLRASLVQISEEDGLRVVVTQNNERAIERREIIEEVRKQLWLAGPLISVCVLNSSLQVISVMFVGHLGELALSGVSMATAFASVSGFSLLIGMASALDTLCGQSYGARNHRMLGIHMQRAMLVLMIISIPLAVIWANTRSILTFFGQDPEISAKAGQYAQFIIPSLFAYGLLQCLHRFLQTQHIVFPMMFFSGVTTLLHILISWIMVLKYGLGTKGAAFAIVISYWFNVLMLTLYVKFSPSCSQTWTGFSIEALHNIPSFLRLAIPSAAMACLEIWSFEMMILLSGILPNPKLETSVVSICLNTASAIWMIPFGLSGAVSTRVSNELGAGHPQAARVAASSVLVLAVVEGVLVGMVLIMARNVWGYAYSNEVEVVRHVAAMMPILAASNFLDGLQCVLSGTARGCGWQKTGALVNLGSYYLVGIPLSIVFTFVFHIGGKGLWLGIICALVVQVGSLMTITIQTDWDQQAKKARHRVDDSMTPQSIMS